MAIGQYNSLYTGKQIDEAITKVMNWIQEDEIKTDMLDDSSVTTNKLADSSVTTEKILDEAIGLNKLSKDLQGKIGEDFVNSVIFKYGLKDSTDITDNENVIDEIYGNDENDFGIHILYRYDDIYNSSNTPIDYSFLIVGAEKKDGVAVVSQTLIKSNGQILYRDMSHPDLVPHEWSEWKSITFTEEILLKEVDQLKSLTIKDAVYFDRVGLGGSFCLENSAQLPFKSFKLYGQTEQTSVLPSPENPQELISVGSDGGIEVIIRDADYSDTQTLTLTTSNGLPAVPISNGGNYTDASGQQWICDEIDLERGVYIQRVGQIEYNPDWAIMEEESNSLYYEALIPSTQLPFSIANSSGLWEMGTYNDDLLSVYNEYSEFSVVYISSDDFSDIDTPIEIPCDINYLIVRVPLVNPNGDILLDMTYEEVRNTCNGSKMLLVREEPLEIPLSVEVVEKYKTLHCYKPTTHIFNTGSAPMYIEYILDTQSYIDDKINTLETEISLLKEQISSLGGS